jgi:hypothetical protein
MLDLALRMKKICDKLPRPEEVVVGTDNMW